MNKKQNILTGLFTVFLLCSIASATPSIPHQFYGSVYVNNQPVSDNTVLTASIDEENYPTITRNSLYGKNPAPVFYVPDPDGDRKDKTITFLISGMTLDTYTFQNNGYTELNFNITTECGDGYCIGGETCESCSQDCGECPTEQLVIQIYSPRENETYNTTSVPLKVSSNHDILIWWYSLNSGGASVFTPNTTLNAKEGENQIFVFAKNHYGQVGSDMVLNFSVRLTEANCSNGIKEDGEECDGSDLGGLTCASYGFDYGTLSCSQECTVLINDCRNNRGGGGDSSTSYNNPSGSNTGSTPPPATTEYEKEPTTEVTEDTCTEEWKCSVWGVCKDGIQKRNCVDVNNCGTEDYRPFETEPCPILKEETNEAGAEAGEEPAGILTGFALAETLQNPGNLAVGIILIVLLLGIYVAFSRNKRNSNKANKVSNKANKAS